MTCFFHSVVHVAKRKGEKKSLHYKVFIKNRFLIPILERCIDEDSSFIPVSGKLFTYQKFYAMVCGVNRRKKELHRLEKEKKMLSKNSDLENIQELEQVAVKSLEEQTNLQRDEINKRKNSS